MSADEQIIPRSIRCTKAEHRYLSMILKRLRAKDFDFSNNPAEPDTQAQDEPVHAEPAPVARFGISPDEFLQKNGLPPIHPAQPTAVSDNEKDYTEWRGDEIMAELDRAINYEMDNFGYPEIAESVARRFPALWVKANKAKAVNRTAEYNEIMTELWEKLNGK